MPIQLNDALYDTVAREFAIRLVAILAGQLHASPRIEFSLDDVTVDAMDLLSNICFFAGVAYEERSGIYGDGQHYTPRVVWQQQGASSDPNLVLGSTHIHELIDAHTLKAGVSRAKKNISLSLN